MKCLWGQGNRYLRVTRKRVEISPKLARIILAGVLVLIGTVFTLSDVGLLNLWKAQKRIENLYAQIGDLEKKNITMQEEIEKLKADPFTIEKVARERYGYLRPGDRVYRIVTLPVEENGGTVIPSSLDRSTGTP
ncbi:MAG TPA: septum formation initiator family protein [Patescibacteria group bacterium]|nr:septum formation initiator family protein [Patescibacteria group bacterium]